jgi:hypothetical protein
MVDRTRLAIWRFGTLFRPTNERIVDTCGIGKTDTDKALVNQSNSL